MMKSKGAPTISFLTKLVFRKRVLPLPTILAITFTAVVVWIQGATIFSSGLYDKSGNLVFYNYVLFHDSNVHLSLIGELSHRFPPTVFNLGGGVLKNYHYLFDLSLAVLHNLTRISILDLYYRLVPITLSVLLSFLIYKTVYALTKSTFASACGIFFTVFATSWGVVMPYVKTFSAGRVVNGSSNLFMTDQLLNMLVNPQGQLSLIVFLPLFLLINNYEETKKLVWLIPFSLMLGLSFGIKAYGGIVFIPGALAAGLYFSIQKRDFKFLVAFFVGLLIMTIWVATTIDGRVSGLKFAPFWLLDHMMADLDKLNEPRFLLLKDYYTSVHNWWRLGLLNIISLVVYITGSLGLRLLGLVAVIKLLCRPSRLTAAFIFLLVASLTSLMIPVLFNQTKKAYDIVQFSPYATIFMGIMFTVALFTILANIKSTLVKAGVVLIFISLFLLMDSREIQPRFATSSEKIVIPASVIQAVDFIQRETPADSVFLLPPSEFNRHYLWFSSLTDRRTTYAGLDFAYQVGADSQSLEQNWQQLFEGKPVPAHFDYVFSLKKEEPLFVKIKEHNRLLTVFDNSQVEVERKVQ